MYPDQSLYPVDSVPAVVRRINNAFRRADQIQWANNINHNDPKYVDYFAPIIADAEAGFGGPLNAFELMKAMIEAGAAGVHFEDQLSSEKKCGHLGGKVLIPIQQHVRTLHGLIPMCAWCKKVRDDDGFWGSVEQYILSHSDALVTHGICPECRERALAQPSR